MAAPLYAYAVVRGDASPPAARGVLDTPVASVRDDGVAVLVSRLKGDRVRAKRRDLLAHSDVVQEAHGNGVVLPLRFGMLFDSEEELRDRLIGPRREELLSLLDEFDGLEEMRVRAVYHDQESVLADVVSGAPDILRLREHAKSQSDLVRLGELVAKRYEHRRAVDAQTIVDRLGTHADRTHVDDLDDELSVLKASFLVRSRKRKEFDAELDAVALRLRHLVNFTCTGPLPPHSFVSLGES
ncbi:MAG: GvpL/GvpF family gas vesicle protein [Gaiellaceae bacterium]